MEAIAARRLFPQTGRSHGLAYTTSNTQLDLNTVAALVGTPLLTKADFSKCNVYVCLLITTEARVAFGTSAVTISDTHDPPFPAGTIIDGIPSGSHVAVKATTSSGVAHFYIGS